MSFWDEIWGPNRGMEGDDWGHARIVSGLLMPGGGEGPFLGLDKCLPTDSVRD